MGGAARNAMSDVGMVTTRTTSRTSSRTRRTTGPKRVPKPRTDPSGALVELHRAANAVRHHVEQAVLRHRNLSWTGFVVLREVHAAEQLETRHAAVRAGIAKATLTGVVNTLTSRGLLRRVRHPEDGRLVLLEVTGRGERLLRDIIPASKKEEAFALAYLDASGVNHVQELMRNLVSHLDGDEAHGRRV
jgi:MarR family transcriptional regulator, organic hydroperoxide resistance regulator